MAKKPLEIDACAGSQLRDTQGEMLSVEGADISDLQAGKGRWNDNHGKGFFNSIGRITGAKKIFKAEDCDDDRQRYYWEKVKAPYIYVKGYLYSDEDHPNAKAAAAILRNIHKADTPLKLKASVEGGVLSRGIADPALLARTKIHSVALTFTPANNATLVEPLSMEKSIDEASDMELIKSVMHLAETNIPSFRHIARDASAGRVRANLERIVELMKGDDSIDIPTKQEILQYALEAKIQNNVAKIHEVIETIRHENMEKGLKDAAMGAAMMGAAAIAPHQAQAPGINPSPSSPAQEQVNLSRMPPTHQAAYEDVAKKNPLLGAIGKIESSGGLNYAHKTIKDGGMHHGQTAGGMFGMMPNAAEYILRNDKNLANKYPELLEASKDIKTNHGVFTKTFNENPKVAVEFAEALLNRNKSKTNSPEMLVHSWNHGLKGTWNKLMNEGPQAIKDADYVKNVMKALSDIKSKSKSTQASKKRIKKSLTAGYGGGAAPMSRVGGGVIQSESLDDGRSGFKYITCDGCGKEQIYAKHQVKCRDCGKSWSLDKLHQAMLGKTR